MQASDQADAPPEENNMYIDNKLLAVALGSLLVGGGAVAAYNTIQSQPASPAQTAAASMVTAPASFAADASAQPAPLNLAAGPDVAFAPIIGVKPVTTSSTRYATVLDVDPVTRQVAQSQPRQVCEDVPVTQRLPERDGNVGGTVAGAVIGGLAGNQLGKNRSSDRRKIETAAGAVGGAFLGRYIDQRHVGGRVVQTTERQCRTVSDSVSRDKVIGYDVTFRNPDGSTGMKRMTSRPGSRLNLGKSNNTAGYDVTYEFNGEQKVVRMDQRPTVDRFRVVDGQVITKG